MCIRDSRIADQTPREHEDQGDDRRILILHDIDGVMAEDLEDHIEQAEIAIKEPAPEQRRDHHGDDPRDQAEHLDEIGEDAVLAIHPEGQQKADADGEERGDDGDLKGEQERLADADILEQADIIAETDNCLLYTSYS